MKKLFILTKKLTFLVFLLCFVVFLIVVALRSKSEETQSEETQSEETQSERGFDHKIQIEEMKLYKDKRNAVKNLPKATGVLADIQKLDLIILRKLDECCEKNNLKYCLTAGTLLGSVRHDGFIPWDDDIDVGMPYDDFEKFKKIVNDDKSMKDFVFLNKKKYMLTKLSFSEFKSNEINIFVDIFPFYPIVDEAHYKKLVEKFLDYQRNHKDTDEENEKLYDIFKEYNQKIYNKDGEMYCFGMDFTFESRLIYKKSDIFPLKKRKFEGFDFNVPNNWDAFLKKDFGDYWELPEVRYSHYIADSEWTKDPKKLNILKKVLEKHKNLIKK